MFNKDDWSNREQGLGTARELLSEPKINPNALELAIWHIWRMAEYAINAGLELAEQRTDRGHQLDKSAEELLNQKLLSQSYGKILGQLERYRKKADYGSYSRERSVHFSAKNVKDCLDQIQSLADEVKLALENKSRLP